MMAREKTHIFRLGAWWWAARLMMTIPSTFSVAFFTIAENLKPEHGGRTFYPRQVVVQGQLIFISMLFVHFKEKNRRTIRRAAPSLFELLVAEAETARAREGRLCPDSTRLWTAGPTDEPSKQGGPVPNPSFAYGGAGGQHPVR